MRDSSTQHLIRRQMNKIVFFYTSRIYSVHVALAEDSRPSLGLPRIILLKILFGKGLGNCKVVFEIDSWIPLY